MCFWYIIVQIHIQNIEDNNTEYPVYCCLYPDSQLFFSCLLQKCQQLCCCLKAPKEKGAFQSNYELSFRIIINLPSLWHNTQLTQITFIEEMEVKSNLSFHLIFLPMLLWDKSLLWWLRKKESILLIFLFPDLIISLDLWARLLAGSAHNTMENSEKQLH